jgi:hypothetical protein
MRARKAKKFGLAIEKGRRPGAGELAFQLPIDLTLAMAG